MKIFVIVFIVLLIGCASTLPNISDTDVSKVQLQWSGVTLEQLRADRELYIVKCSGCHGLYTPNQHSKEEWNLILSEMTIKSKLNSNEREQIQRYLFIFSSEKHLSN